ncbi:helix-turn-helix transcriptional regulator [Streptomonospora litoralis]|uniref:Protein involved in sporulation n=1 Tax=Streptomonospora litoralis TaxID=2498135 RepID=A0A4P6Q7D1_9ACTN|nr:helix-turn-helix transcriptional regulator [Streptomonospora litoralis]QBI56698.1 Protein involved in sporulation [Streptomonospora litoralis]
MAEGRPELLKSRRRELGWSQARLAEALCAESGRATVTRQEVYRWESGRRIPKFWLPHLSAVLHVPRARMEQAIARSRTGVSPDLAELLPDDESAVSLRDPDGGRRRAGRSDAARLSARVHALRLADDFVPGKDLAGSAFAELDAAVLQLKQGANSEAVQREMETSVGEFAQIAGWIASDAGWHNAAERTYRLGLAVAREAGDTTLAGQLAGCLAYQWSNTGRETEGTALAEAALAEAGAGAPPRARAIFWDRLAWAHTKAADPSAAVRALGEAEAALSRHGDEDDPAWLYWVDEGELRVMEARVFTELHRPLRAVPLLEQVLSRYDTTHTRTRALPVLAGRRVCRRERARTGGDRGPHHARHLGPTRQ